MLLLKQADSPVELSAVTSSFPSSGFMQKMWPALPWMLGIIEYS